MYLEAHGIIDIIGGDGVRGFHKKKVRQCGPPGL